MQLLNDLGKSLTESTRQSLLWFSWLLIVPFPLVAQDAPQDHPIRSEVKHVDSAEARSVTNDSGFVPDRQPPVYWHGVNWRIDLMPTSRPNSISLSINSEDKKDAIVKLPGDYSQIDSVSVGPHNKAIVIAHINGMTEAICIIDLDSAMVIDNIGLYAPIVSPDRRFILFNDWYPPHAEEYENRYSVYDTLKTPAENAFCRIPNSHDPADLRGAVRGFQVYPALSSNERCMGEDDDDDNIGTNFTWATDSSKIVFADVKSGVMSLVLVTMPAGVSDLPKTSVYTLKGAQDVCAGATDATGEESCDFHVIQSLGWNGNTVEAAFHHQFGTPLNLQLTIPVSSFVPIGK